MSDDERCAAIAERWSKRLANYESVALTPADVCCVFTVGIGDSPAQVYVQTSKDGFLTPDEARYGAALLNLAADIAEKARSSHE